MMRSTENFNEKAAALIPAEVRMISGCHSEQTSADVSNVGAVAQLPNPAGRAGGACTSALLDVLYAAHRTNNNITFQELLLRLRESLANSGFEQIPQLTSSRPLEMNEVPFRMVGGSGQRRALLVGINYIGQSGELSGCHNDVMNIKKYIKDVHGFPEKDITVLVDDARHGYPTRQKIITGLQNLVTRSRAGDSVYFHYSGHGGLLAADFNMFKNKNSDYDETIYPLDHERSGHIRDFSLFNKFVKPMAAGVTVTCVMDCCHSGSVLELPYSFRPTDAGTIQTRENFDTLSNLAFLYVLAGGILPHGFGDVSGHIEEVVDDDLDNFQGTGIESAMDDELDDTGFDTSPYAEMEAMPEDEFEAPDDSDEPFVVPGDPAMMSDEPVVVPGDPVMMPDDPIVVPGDPVMMPDEPIVVPGEPVTVSGIPADIYGYEEEMGGAEDRGFGDFDAGEAEADDGGDAGLDCGAFSECLGSFLDNLGDDGEDEE